MSQTSEENTQEISILTVRLLQPLHRNALTRLRKVFPTVAVQTMDGSHLMITILGSSDEAIRVAEKIRKTKYVLSVSVSVVVKELWNDLVISPLKVYTVLAKIKDDNPFRPIPVLGNHHIVEVFSALDKIYLGAGIIFSASCEELEALALEAGQSAMTGLTELEDFGFLSIKDGIFTPTESFIDRFDV